MAVYVCLSVLMFMSTPMSISVCLCLCPCLCQCPSLCLCHFYAYSLYRRATRGKIHLPERATTRNANFTKIAKFTKIHYGVIFAGKIYSSCWALLDISFEVLCCLANFPSFPKFRRRVQTWTYVARLVKKGCSFYS